MSGGGSGEGKQVLEVTGDLHPGYLEVSLQPVKLSLYQMAAIMEVEIYLGGEGDDMRRAQIPAEGSKGRGQRWGLYCIITHPSGEGRSVPSPPGPPGYLYHRPSLFPGILKRAL